MRYPIGTSPKSSQTFLSFTRCSFLIFPSSTQSQGTENIVFSTEDFSGRLPSTKLIALSEINKRSSEDKSAVSFSVSSSWVERINNFELISSNKIAPILNGFIKREIKKFFCGSLLFKKGNCIK